MKFDYVLIVAGVLLAFVAAVVPYYSGAYHLLFGVLLAHLLPYLLYAPAAVRLDRPETTVVGVIVVGVHGVLVIKQRLMDGADYGWAIYAVPLLLAVLLLPLFIRAARRPWEADVNSR